MIITIAIDSPRIVTICQDPSWSSMEGRTRKKRGILLPRFLFDVFVAARNYILADNFFRTGMATKAMIVPNNKTLVGSGTPGVLDPNVTLSNPI
jgi:hypothetical protein